MSQGVVAVELDHRDRNVVRIAENVYVLTCPRKKCERRHLLLGPEIYRVVTEAMETQHARIRHVYLRDVL
jgi:hypothetical protein